MKKIILLLIWLLLVFFTMASFYVSYSAFVTERNKKIGEDIAALLISIPQQNIVYLPYPELLAVKINKEGKIIRTANTLKPLDLAKYDISVRRVEGDSVEVYVRKPSLDEFIIFLVSKPVFGGLLAFIFVIYVSFFYLTVSELREVKIIKKVEERKDKLNREEILKKLKAVKLLFHTEKILKEESVEKAKKIVDELINEIENK
ncbi:hypothetical protein JCM9492_06680 [Aquifex pyrophilus]